MSPNLQISYGGQVLNLFCAEWLIAAMRASTDPGTCSTFEISSSVDISSIVVRMLTVDEFSGDRQTFEALEELVNSDELFGRMYGVEMPGDVRASLDKLKSIGVIRLTFGFREEMQAFVFDQLGSCKSVFMTPKEAKTLLGYMDPGGLK